MAHALGKKRSFSQHDFHIPYMTLTFQYDALDKSASMMEHSLVPFLGGGCCTMKIDEMTTINILFIVEVTNPPFS
eukprot:m.24341 g.24341  ORF g.24341 m.24341 type:complete len:75 (+) comp5639_c0_seq3:331-555(+)